MDRKMLALLARMKPTDMERLLARVQRQSARKRARFTPRRKALLPPRAALDRELALLGGAAGRGVPSAAAGRPRGRGVRRRGGPTSRDVAHDILVRRGEPMELGQLAKAVLASGRFRSSSPVFAQNLGMALRQDPRFRKVGRGLYAAAAGRRATAGKAIPSGKKASRKGRRRRAGGRKGGGRKAGGRRAKA